MSSAKFSQRLHCETLEARENPAGNAFAFISNGEVIIIGDAQNNRVNVEQTGFGDIVVTGLDNTTINGQNSVYLGRGIPTGLQVDMGAGNDRIEVIGMAVSGNMMVNGGSGDDSIVMLSDTAAGFVYVTCGEGNDGPYLSNIRTSWVVIDGGPGTDIVHADNVFTNQGLFLFNVDGVY